MDMEKREAAVIQNLKDAGCDKDTITSFMEHYEAGEVKQESRLSGHRKALWTRCMYARNRLTAWITWHGRSRRKRGGNDRRPSDSGDSHRSVVRRRSGPDYGCGASGEKGKGSSGRYGTEQGQGCMVLFFLYRGDHESGGNLDLYQK